MLLVDHNVKSVSALVDRVLAMYLGKRIAEGRATEGDAGRDRAPRLSRRRAGRSLAGGPAVQIARSGIVLDHAKIVWEGPPERFEAEAAADYL